MINELILAVSVLCAVRFLFNVRQPLSASRTASKTIATVSLSLFALHCNGPTLIPLSLGLAALGDYFLAISDTDSNFLRGLSSFLLAHLVYIKLLLSQSSGVELLLSWWPRLALLLLMSLVAPTLNYLMFTRVARKLRIPVAVYSVAIFAMFVSALCVKDAKVTSGAILFTFSDAILATDRFLLPRGSEHAAWMQYAVWVLYYLGQLLLTLGLSA